MERDDQEGRGAAIRRARAAERARARAEEAAGALEDEEALEEEEEEEESEDELERVRAARQRYLRLLGDDAPTVIPDAVNLGLDVSVEELLAEDDAEGAAGAAAAAREQERRAVAAALKRTTWTEAVVLGARVALEDDEEEEEEEEEEEDEDEQSEDREERRRRQRRERERRRLLAEASTGPSRALRLGLTGAQSRLREFEGTHGRQIRHHARATVGDMDRTEHATAAGVFRGAYRSGFARDGGARSSEQEQKAEEERQRAQYDDLRIERTSERMFSLTGKYFGGVAAIVGGPQREAADGASKKKKRGRRARADDGAPLSERIERHVDTYVSQSQQMQRQREQQQQQQRQQGVFLTGLDLEAAQEKARGDEDARREGRERQLVAVTSLCVADLPHCEALAPRLADAVLPLELAERPVRLPPEVNTDAVLQRAAAAATDDVFLSGAHRERWEAFYGSDRAQLLFLDATWRTLARYFCGGPAEVQEAMLDRMSTAFVALCVELEPQFKDDMLLAYSGMLPRAVFLALKTMFREEEDGVFDLAFARRLATDAAEWVLGFVPGEVEQAMRAWHAGVDKKVEDAVPLLFLPPEPDHEEKLSERLNQAALTGGPTEGQREKWRQQQQNVGSTELVQQTARSVAQNMIRSSRKQRPSFEPPPEPDESQEPYQAALVPIRVRRELATVGHSALVARFLARRGVSTSDLAVQLPISRADRSPGLRAAMRAMYSVKADADEARAKNTKLLQNYNKVNRKFEKLARKEAEHYQEQRRKLEKNRQIALKDPHTFAASILLESKMML